MPPKRLTVSVKTQIEEAKRKGREKGRKEGMADLFAALKAADGGQSQADMLRTNYFSDNEYFHVRVDNAFVNAVDRNREELVLFLLKAGADVDSLDDETNRTALHCAVQEGHAEMVTTLLKAGADPNIRDEYDDDIIANTPLASAVEGGNMVLVKALLKAGAHASVNKDEPGKGYWLIEYEAEDDHVEMTRTLLKAGAYVGPYGDEAWTPLMSAAYYGKTKAAALLIKAGSDVNAQTNDGTSVLMKAAQGGKAGALDTIHLLLKYGAKVNLKDNDGYTALMSAAAAGHSEVVRLLLSAGADVFSRAKAREESYYTPARKGGCAIDVADDAAVKQVIKSEMHRRIAAALSVLLELPLEVRQKIVQLYKEN